MKRRLAVLLCFLLLFVSFSSPVSGEGLTVSANSAVVINAASGGILFEKNAQQKLPMASTTKIMTALLLAEQPDLNKTIVTTKQMVTVEGSSMGLKEGDTVSYHDLLYGMLLASGNDAANTTAYALGGSVNGFVKLMNEKAAKLGLNNTSFVTPSGLDAENHYTTAYDLAMLAAFAMKNQEFKKAAGSKSARLCYGNPPYNRTLTNHNKLLNSYDGAVGVKTGFTKKSGRCLVSAAERNGALIVAVTLDAPDDWDDHTAMLDYGFSCVSTYKAQLPQMDDTALVIGGDCDRVRLLFGDTSLCLAEGELAKIRTEIHLPQFLYPPLAANQTVGSINYYIGTQLVKSVPIMAAGDVKVVKQKLSFSKKLLNSIFILLQYI